MTTPDARIEAALRAAEPPIADDDFSSTVLARLPPRKPQRVVRDLHRALLVAAAWLGGVAAWWLAPPLERAIAALAALRTFLSLPFALVLAIVILIPMVYFLYAERADR